MYQSQHGTLCNSLKQLFVKLETAGDAVEPFEFLNYFFGAFPQFAEKGEHGGFQQQDADECFQNLLTVMEPVFPNKSGGSLIEELFGFNVQFELKNTEDENEPATTNFETMRRLPCIIDNQASPVNTLTEGIEAGLVGDLEKFSEPNNRNCIYKKTGKIASLPKYMIVQKIRFIWKASDEGTNTQARKAKILRNVSFPKILDLEPYITEELKASLKSAREGEKKKLENMKQKDTERFEEYKKDFSALDEMKAWKQFKEVLKKEAEQQHDKILWRELDDTGQKTGEYEQIGVITHQGRSSESGHYIGWVQEKGDKWYKYDDDYVTNQNLQNILDLRGGGDWHMAYYMIYRRLEVDPYLDFQATAEGGEKMDQEKTDNKNDIIGEK